mgnify:CR=1 FL=1
MYIFINFLGKWCCMRENLKMIDHTDKELTYGQMEENTLENLTSPLEELESPDARKLGILVKSIYIKPI